MSAESEKDRTISIQLLTAFSMAATFVAGFAIILLLVLTLSTRPGWQIAFAPEASTGILIVLAVAVLAFLLYVLTAGFRILGLHDPAQPLGLPSGSVRAFIALMLIMIFVILSVYSVSVVGEGNYRFLGVMALDESEVLDLAGNDNFAVEPLPEEEGLYEVWTVRPVSEGGDRLAQQLVTTVATLVVAVAGFYFGSKNIKTALAALGGDQESSTAPLIRDLNPKSGKRGETVTVTLTGRNLASPKSVRLVKEEAVIEATNILSNDTTIQCKFALPAVEGSTGKWSVVVENIDGDEDRLPDAFEITNDTAVEATELGN